VAQCLICRGPVSPFMSFGKMPIANGFLAAEDFAREYFFELKVAFCERCTMVQLTELVDEKKMFHDNYAFFSSTSTRMAQHFERLANWVRAHYLAGKDPFIVEIGSNDGILLKHFAAARIRHLGVEPSANVAKVAADEGIRTLCRFFDEKLAHEIVAEHGQADVCLGANVMCHIPYLHSVAAGINTLLKRKGVLVFEDPYLGDIVEKTSYDQIYDEHAFYFSLSSVQRLLAEHDLEVVDALPQQVHGGSMRYVVAHQGAYPIAESVARVAVRERDLGLGHPAVYERLKKNIERSRESLMGLLESLRRQRMRVVGYGATSKSTTVTNYCGITPEHLEFISDTTPIKLGKFSPGAHIPVRPYAEFTACYPEYALLFAWNHWEEIRDKEQAFTQAGGKFIGYVPRVGELS
jgi:methylation protein EvaC